MIYSISYIAWLAMSDALAGCDDSKYHLNCSESYIPVAAGCMRGRWRNSATISVYFSEQTLVLTSYSLFTVLTSSSGDEGRLEKELVISPLQYETFAA